MLTIEPDNGRPHYDQGSKCMLSRQAYASGFATQILRTAEPHLSVPEGDLDVLDVGSGYGFTTVELGRRCRSVVGIEPCDFLFTCANEYLETMNVTNVGFKRLSVNQLRDVARYDLVVLDNVLEHIAEQRDALRRISDSLKPNGVLFIIAPNKLWPLEVHYGLPFLSYLPLRFANMYLSITGKGSDYSDASYALTYWGLSRLFSTVPELSYRFVLPADVSLAMLGRSLHYRAGVAAIRCIPLLWIISKLFVVIAIKK